VSFDLDPKVLLSPQVVGVGAVLLGLLLGWLIARVSSRRSRDQGRRRRAHRRPRRAGPSAAAVDISIDGDTEVRDLKKTLYLLQNENRNLSTFLMTLPDLARQLNSDIDKRKIPDLLIVFIEQLFEANQILVFLTGQDNKHLILAGGKGIPPRLQGQQVIPIGRGRIGWVAQQQITMDEQDFTKKARAGTAELAGNLNPLFRTELCAPMVTQDRTIGAISLGGLLRRPKNERNMLKMVADLGSIAIQNSMLFSMIRESANRDGLTGLFNKRYFMANLAEAILHAEKNHQNLSLFIFDIDHFKTYNDTNGHLAGDEALKITGRILSESVREGDLAARYGGEEFVVILPDTSKKNALAAAQKIRKTVEEYDYPHEGSQPSGKVTISGGVATYPYDARNTGDIIRCADDALYRGKKEGRNRVYGFENRYLSDDHSERPAASGGQEA